MVVELGGGREQPPLCYDAAMLRGFDAYTGASVFRNTSPMLGKLCAGGGRGMWRERARRRLRQWFWVNPGSAHALKLRSVCTTSA